MFLGMVEDHCQHKGTAVLLNGHPCISQQDCQAAIHFDGVVVIIYQLLRLFARTDGNRLVRMNLIERSGHGEMLPLVAYHTIVFLDTGQRIRSCAA